MLTLLILSLARAGSPVGLPDWPAIVRRHPVAYRNDRGKLQFYNRNGDSIGQMASPALCFGMGMSADGKFAHFKLTGPPDDYKPYVLVVDQEGRTAAADIPVRFFHAAWTKDDSLAIFSDVRTDMFMPRKVGAVSIVHVHEPMNYMSLTATGPHPGIACHASSSMLGTPPPEGAFWLDENLRPSGTIFAGKSVSGVFLAPDGKYLAAVIQGKLILTRVADGKVVFQGPVGGPTHLAWTSTGHKLAVAIDVTPLFGAAGVASAPPPPPSVIFAPGFAPKPKGPIKAPASIVWILDVDGLKLAKRPLPSRNITCVSWSDPNTLFVAGEGRIDLLNTRTGAWTHKADFPKKHSVMPL